MGGVQMRQRFAQLCMTSVVFSVWLPQTALTWGIKGHKAVAIIAQDRLTPAAASKVQAILGATIGLDDIALCADDIKRHSVNCGGIFQLKMSPQTKNWHFIDIPISDSPTAKDLDQYCLVDGKPDNCVTLQAQHYIEVLKDDKAAQFEKQEALMYVVHFIGDMNQPLHCATDIDENGNSDAGGNGKDIYYPGMRTASNLHHVWDNFIEKDSAMKHIDVK